MDFPPKLARKLSTLPLFVLGVFTDNPDHTTTFNQFTFVTNFFY